MVKKPCVQNPSDPVLWCKEAAARIEAGDHKGAIYCYEESLKIRPEVPDVWYNLGLLLEKIGQPTAALGCLQEVVDTVCILWGLRAKRG